ncbi:MAG: hypothetical protein HYU36_06680 [Planctomycetes bacterium]|nr:hypothetical protein [Planctomycetota bacterium]
MPGSEQRAFVVFYPGTARQRARFLRRDGAAAAVHTRVPRAETIRAFLESLTPEFARQPWLTSFGAVLHDITLMPREDGWFARDSAGYALPLMPRPYGR